ncbi:MAG TPA: respiratory nitrate reductase subunit gamma [Bacteroidales bacterium]|nr:respiratory nitrate reductase subunit gamma [Bacteroidales bacterium]
MNGIFFFIVLPYLAIFSLLPASIYKYRAHGFKVSSLSSQLLENRLLFFGSRPFHWGIILLFFGHLIAFLIPSSVLAWNSKPLRLYILETAALSFGILALIGLTVLISRRLRVKRVRLVTSRMDIFVFLILSVQLITGLYTAIFLRWGSSWFASVLTPYLISIFAFRPDITAIVALPVMVKIHIVSAFVLIGMIPYTRFMHFLVYPFVYLWRSYQVVIWNRLSRSRHLPSLLLIALLSSVALPACTNAIHADDSVIGKSGTAPSEEIIRGQRLFYGLVYPGDESKNCAGCHNTAVTDTLNWYPDAVAISRKYKSKSAEDLGAILLTPSGKMMTQVHKNIRLSDEEITLIKGYMDELSGTSLIQPKQAPINLVLFIIASLLFLVSAVDLIITKRIRKRWVNPIILSVTGLYITVVLVVNAIALGRTTGYSPDQPVKFSHQIHAGQNGTDCIYCHNYAPYSKSAGIPAQNICMNCHLLVRNGTRSGMFEIAKVVESYEANKPIEWIRVYNIQEHVFFSHAQHVTAGGIDCTECHGEVAGMTRIVQVPDLSMRWCINCHRTRSVNFGGNNFYTQYKEWAGRIQKGDIDSVTVEWMGGTECMKCHY